MGDYLIATLTNEHYITPWRKYYKTKNLKTLQYDISWHILFSMIYKHPKFKNINKRMKELVKKNISIYPHPSHITSAFILTEADTLKVVFIGNEDKSTHTMGLLYSVPNNTEIPNTLKNIFNNLYKYKHINSIPHNGNLWYWAVQGCLMLNTTLTMGDDKQEHINIWSWFVDYVIQYISQYMDNIIFVLWGGSSYKKINLIDLDKHHTIISSHPSDWTQHKKFNDYPAFMDYDHFGQINKILSRLGKEQIIWD